MGRRVVDLTGHRYGGLTVVEMCEERCQSSGRIKWLCRCDCGAFREVIGNMLRNKNARSCGCLTRRTLAADLVMGMKGKKYGRWEVIGTEPVIKGTGKKSYPRKYWLCKCECGTVKEVYNVSLRKGISQHCGCLNDSPNPPA